jgi:hypothetical protein
VYSILSFAKKTYIYYHLCEWFIRNDGKISNAYYHANIQCVKKINTSFCPSSITVPVEFRQILKAKLQQNKPKPPIPRKKKINKKEKKNTYPFHLLWVCKLILTSQALLECLGVIHKTFQFPPKAWLGEPLLFYLFLAPNSVCSRKGLAISLCTILYCIHLKICFIHLTRTFMEQL